MGLDEKFAKKFNAGLPLDRQYTIEQLNELFNAMPDQRIGALFDFVRWVKATLRK